MALFRKSQERLNYDSDKDNEKRSEYIRVMESDDSSFSSQDRMLFAETLREVVQVDNN